MSIIDPAKIASLAAYTKPTAAASTYKPVNAAKFATQVPPTVVPAKQSVAKPAVEVTLSESAVKYLESAKDFGGKATEVKLGGLESAKESSKGDNAATGGGLFSPYASTDQVKSVFGKVGDILRQLAAFVDRHQNWTNANEFQRANASASYKNLVSQLNSVVQDTLPNASAEVRADLQRSVDALGFGNQRAQFNVVGNPAEGKKALDLINRRLDQLDFFANGASNRLNAKGLLLG